MSIDEIIAERERTHGDWIRNAEVSQRLKNIFSDEIEKHRHGVVGLSYSQRETLSLICLKLARIVCGDPNHADHWRDIGGYARLGELDAQSRSGEQMSEHKSLSELIADADLVRRVCRQMCIDDGIDPDTVWVEAYDREFKNYEHHVANVNAVLRALKAIAS